jgi:hypothetical protein
MPRILAAASRPPCDDCRHLKRCCSEPIACESAALFLTTGRFSALAPRQPSREIFERIHAPAPPEKSAAERERRLMAVRLDELRRMKF